MLNIWFGDMPDVIYNTSVFFKNTYAPRWIIDPLAVEMIADVDRSRVVSEQLIRTSGKYHTFQRMYQRSDDRLYALASEKLPAVHALTEDSRAGYQFYQHYYDGTSVTCHSAGSNSGVFAWLQKHHDEGVFVIADGVAFGAEMNRVMELQHQFPDKITICLPECFEWLILQSGLIGAPDLGEMLENPSAYVDSTQYFSWENFFEDYLVKQTAGTHYAYQSL